MYMSSPIVRIYICDFWKGCRVQYKEQSSETSVVEPPQEAKHLTQNIPGASKQALTPHLEYLGKELIELDNDK